MKNDEDTTVEGTGFNYAKGALKTEHGAVDVEATLLLVREELTKWVIDHEIDPTKIKDALTEVYGKFPATATKQMIDLNGLTIQALAALKAPFGSETRIGSAIKDFVRGESKRFEDTNGEEGAVMIMRGKKGGVYKSTPAFVAEYRALQAKKLAAAQ